MDLPIFTVDAFTNRAFKGNPAAVCLPSTDLDEATMKGIAAEMNLSETAFVRPRPDGSFSLRWFTPAVEVPLCGHATLASAAVLLRERRVKDPVLRFHTLSGELRARAVSAGIELDFPAEMPTTASPSKAIEAALGNPTALEWHVGARSKKLLLVLKDEAAVRALKPDFGKLRVAGEAIGLRGLIVTARGTQVDFVSRYFAVWVGIDEDPVTGSAHTVLTPYWAAKLGKSSMKAHQASARGGDLLVELAGDRVKMSGEAVVTLRGNLSLPDVPALTVR